MSEDLRTEKEILHQMEERIDEKTLWAHMEKQHWGEELEIMLRC